MHRAGPRLLAAALFALLPACAGTAPPADPVVAEAVPEPAGVPAGEPAPAAETPTPEELAAWFGKAGARPLDAEAFRGRLAACPASAQPGLAAAIARSVAISSALPDDLAAEALRTAVRLGDRGTGGILLQLSGSKLLRDRPAVIAAMLEGAGALDPAGSRKDCLKVAKRSLGRDAVVATAALRAASRHVTADAVDDLIDLLERAEHVVASSAGAQRDAAAAARDEILRILPGMTGASCADGGAWEDWWKSSRKTWKPPAAPR